MAVGVLSVNGGTQLYLDLTYRPQSLLIDAGGHSLSSNNRANEISFAAFLYIQVAQAHDFNHSEVHGSHLLTRQQIIKQQLGLHRIEAVVSSLQKWCPVLFIVRI